MTNQPEQPAVAEPQSAMDRREWAWAILGCALAATLFLSPALFTGRILSPADLTFAFGAYLPVWLLYPLGNSAIWLPWLWWATARLIAQPGPRPLALLAGLVMLQTLGGHAETVYHAGLATGLFALFQIVQTG